MTKIAYDVSNVAARAHTWASEVEEERLDWFWPGLIPYGKITLLDGDPGLGKSTITVSLAAANSRAGYLPSGQPLPEAGVALMVSAEDNFADTIKPRLRAAGADMGMVAMLALRRDEEGRVIPFSVPEDMPRLEDAIRQTDASYVVIDPITAFLSESVQSHNDASVRKAMSPLAQLAQETRAAFVLLRHLTKDTGTTRAMYRGGGSIGFTGSARSVLLAAPKPGAEGVNVLAQTKGNLSRGQARSLLWRVESWPQEPAIPRIRWLGETELSADDLLKAHDARRDDPARREGVEVLREILAERPQPAKVVAEEAAEAGVKPATLKAAAKKLGVHRYRVRRSDGSTAAWRWHLPEQACPPGCSGGQR